MGHDEGESLFHFPKQERPDFRLKEVDDAIRFLQGNPLLEPIKALDDLHEGDIILEAGSHFWQGPGEEMEKRLYPAVTACQIERYGLQGMDPLQPSEFHINAVGDDLRILFGRCVKHILRYDLSDGQHPRLAVYQQQIVCLRADDKDNPYVTIQFTDDLLCSGRFFRQRKQTPTPSYIGALLGVPQNNPPPKDFPGELARIL